MRLPSSVLLLLALHSLATAQVADSFGEGLELVKAGRFREALERFEGDIEASPDGGSVDYAYGWALHCASRLGDPDKTLEYYRVIRTRFPGRRISSGTGAARDWTDKLVAAKDLVARMDDPRAQGVLNQMAELDEKDVDSATDGILGTHVWNVRADSKGPRFRLARERAEAGNDREALELLATNIAAFPGSVTPEEHAWASLCAARTGDWEKSLHHYEEIRARADSARSGHWWWRAPLVRSCQSVLEETKAVLARNGGPEAARVLEEISRRDREAVEELASLVERTLALVERASNGDPDAELELLAPQYQEGLVELVVRGRLVLATRPDEPSPEEPHSGGD